MPMKADAKDKRDLRWSQKGKGHRAHNEREAEKTLFDLGISADWFSEEWNQSRPDFRHS
jgi:hypothetical protein